jgi:uncharacterized membrane protein
MARRTILLTALFLWCAALLALRMERTGTMRFGFLVWNLFLAFVPLVASSLLAIADRRRSSILVQGGWFALWLVFLPNAPYLLTDLIHLRHRPPVPLWYDLALILSYALTGLLLGYTSLAIVQRIVARRFGNATGWLVAIASMGLSGFGIYLGRFLRWNSWEVLTRPAPLFAFIADCLLNPRSHAGTVAVTVIFGGALILGYVALDVFLADLRETRAARERG